MVEIWYKKYPPKSQIFSLCLFIYRCKLGDSRKFRLRASPVGSVEILRVIPFFYYEWANWYESRLNYLEASPDY